MILIVHSVTAKRKTSSRENVNLRTTDGKGAEEDREGVAHEPRKEGADPPLMLLEELRERLDRAILCRGDAVCLFHPWPPVQLRRPAPERHTNQFSAMTP
jgi:hypothetical protein